MTVSTKEIISVNNLWFAYNQATVLEDINLHVDKLDFVCIVGPNGGGKTTLLKLLVGLLQPMQGSVQIAGHSPLDIRSRVGYMPQHAYLDPHFPVSVLDVVLMGRLGEGRIIGPYRKADREAAMEVLNQVGLAEVCRKPFSALSGGQQQRVLLARALVCDPKLLLLDEPTANLDLMVEGELLELLRALNERVTVVLVSHNLGFVSKLVKKIVCVNRTAHVHEGSNLTAEILSEIYGSDVRVVSHEHDLHSG